MHAHFYVISLVKADDTHHVDEPYTLELNLLAVSK